MNVSIRGLFAEAAADTLGRGGTLLKTNKTLRGRLSISPYASKQQETLARLGIFVSKEPARAFGTMPRGLDGCGDDLAELNSGH